MVDEAGWQACNEAVRDGRAFTVVSHVGRKDINVSRLNRVTIPVSADLMIDDCITPREQKLL